eukprot:4922967-Pleurochrysis_carterae.AAC.1
MPLINFDYFGPLCGALIHGDNLTGTLQSEAAKGAVGLRAGGLIAQLRSWLIKVALTGTYAIRPPTASTAPTTAMAPMASTAPTAATARKAPTAATAATAPKGGIAAARFKRKSRLPQLGRWSEQGVRERTNASVCIGQAPQCGPIEDRSLIRLFAGGCHDRRKHGLHSRPISGRTVLPVQHGCVSQQGCARQPGDRLLNVSGCDRAIETRPDQSSQGGMNLIRRIDFYYLIRNQVP